MAIAEATEIVQFWYGEVNSPTDKISSEKIKKWYRGGEEYDNEIRRKYKNIMHEALNKKLVKFDSWKADEIGCLALILMADQFSRNIYRGTAEAFKYDKYAQELCLNGIKLGIDIKLLNLHPRYTYFFYHPLLHSEDLELQQLFQKKQSEYYEILDKKKDDENKKHFSGSGKKYLQLIKDFGRFPHRNKILGRKSTAKELEAISKMEYNPIANSTSVVSKSSLNTVIFGVMVICVALIVKSKLSY